MTTVQGVSHNCKSQKYSMMNAALHRKKTLIRGHLYTGKPLFRAQHLYTLKPLIRGHLYTMKL